MSVIAVDIDGTATAAPEVFQVLLKSLMDAGHEVYMLTGALTSDSPGGTISSRIEQLITCGLHRGIHFVDVHIFIDKDVRIIARMKADFCQRHGAILFIDDSDLYQETVMVHSPNTFRLWPHAIRPSNR